MSGNPWKVAKDVGGVVRQSSMPKMEYGQSPMSANGLMVRGCVINSYPINPQATVGADATELPPGGRQTTVYCDVLLYTALPGARNRLLHKVLVGTSRGGIHDDRIWVPRAARRDLRSGNTVTAESVRHCSPSDLDGDHVLVGFMDNDLRSPVILNGVPHPRNDISEVQGNGETEYHRHRGTIWGSDGRGNFTIDTTQANGGEYKANLDEVGPPLDGSCGDISLVAQAGATAAIIGASNLLIMYPSGEVQLRGSLPTNGHSLKMGTDGALELRNGILGDGIKTDIIMDANGDMQVNVGDDRAGGITRNLTIRANDTTVISQGTHTDQVPKKVIDAGLVQVGSNATNHPIISENLQQLLNTQYTGGYAALSAALETALAPAGPIALVLGAGPTAALLSWVTATDQFFQLLSTFASLSKSFTVTVKD